MRFGSWREVTLTLVVVTGFSSTASAFGLFHHTIPREAQAYNVHTGQAYLAPPVPFGEYAKDYSGSIHGAMGTLGGGGLFHGGGAGDCGAGCRGGLFHGHGHGHGHGMACDDCGGAGCRRCRGMGHGAVPSAQVMPSGQACRACGGAGCGRCRGLFHGRARACDTCGGAGCDDCQGMGHGHGARMGGLFHGLLDPHAGKVQYFMGAGGPVPLTPGYVPYVVTTRSPRDFFAFPPFSPDAP